MVSGDCALCSVEVLKYVPNPSGCRTCDFTPVISHQIHPDARGRVGRCAWAT